MYQGFDAIDPESLRRIGVIALDVLGLSTMGGCHGVPTILDQESSRVRNNCQPQFPIPWLSWTEKNRSSRTVLLHRGSMSLSSSPSSSKAKYRCHLFSVFLDSFARSRDFGALNVGMSLEVDSRLTGTGESRLVDTRGTICLHGPGSSGVW